MKCKVTKGKSGKTGKRSSNTHSLSAPPLPPGCFSQKWTPSEEKKWIRNLTKHVFGDETFFRASYFALHDSLRSTGPSCSLTVIKNILVSHSAHSSLVSGSSNDATARDDGEGDAVGERRTFPMALFSESIVVLAGVQWLPQMDACDSA